MKPFLPFCSSFLFIHCTVCARLIPSCYFHSMWDILHTSYTNFLFSLYYPKTRFRQQSSFHSFSDPYSTICDLWSEGFDIILCLYSLKFLPCTCCLKECCCVLTSCTLSVICGRNTTVSLQLVPGIVFFFFQGLQKLPHACCSMERWKKTCTPHKVSEDLPLSA